MKRRWVRGLLNAGAVHIVLVNLAYAQNAGPVGNDATSEFVVTAERRETSLLQTPLSISVIGAEELVRIGADHPSEVLFRVPGVFIHRGSGQEHLTSIRSPILTGGAGAGSFLYLENGVPLRSAGFANVNGLFEAQTELAGDIEVVKGPSGAFYGANAIHGVINILPQTSSEDFFGFFDFSGDTIERFKGKALISDTIGNHGFVAGVSILDDAGFRADSGVDQQKAHFRHIYSGNDISIDTFLSFTNLNQETAGFVEGDDAFLDPVLRRTNPNPEAFRDARSAHLSSRIDIDVSEKVTISTTPFARWTDQDFLLHFLPSQALEESGHWSIGSQNAIYFEASDRLSISGGFDWEYTEGFLTEFQEIPTIFSFTQGLHYDFDVTALSFSGFGNVTYAITDRLTATGALRVDWTQYDYVNNTDANVVGRFLRPESRTDQFTTASPKFSLIYDTGNGSLYASYSRGARPPQVTDLYRLQINQTEDPAGPETIDAFELGWRGELNERIYFETAAYFMDKRNFFFRDADGFNVDDGRTRHVGFESKIDATLSDAFSVNMNVSYGVHTYRFDRPVNSTLNGTDSVTFGDDVDSAPRWLAGARGLWTPKSLPLDAEAEWVFVDDYFLDASNSRTYRGHNLVHLRGSWHVTDYLTIYGTIRNLLDTFYAERADFAFGDERFFPGEERTFTVGLRLSN